ncbi:DUF3613 domain-containing protein [uncultured Ralstonia sp.]|jgi:hypothetical protein|uniref:DUF3613 domain-containing protein n=1 Tax=Ralstonia sp. TaxID=54061 RepID=UPI001EA82D14|nr:DUF3613 domain-containing protein [uncultured Ralstonia sp.]UCF25069.1 MAG: DUF3613 domain-containing protein [Ralstonia sp.]
MSDKIVHAVCVATLLWSGWAAAQGFSSTADSASPAAPKTSRNVNDAARALLSAQRDGTYAGEAAPLRGEQAALAYQRYLDTFSRPMPGLSQGSTGQRSGAPQTTSGTPR